MKTAPAYLRGKLSNRQSRFPVPTHVTFASASGETLSVSSRHVLLQFRGVMRPPSKASAAPDMNVLSPQPTPTQRHLALSESPKDVT